MNQSEEQKQLRQLLSSPQGKQLLRLLTRDGGAAMQSAGEALKRGDSDAVRQIMEPMLEDPEVKRLLRETQQSLGHG